MTDQTDNKKIAIRVNNVSKTFKLPHEKQTSLKGAVINFYRKQRTYEVQKVLTDVSFEIQQGEFFGIVGRNGSGKSTLLKLIAGIYNPEQGTIDVNGRLTPFIELGVGFNPELTGRENVFLNGALLGFNRREMTKMYQQIVDFAEIEKFMDQKLKNYSSGMQVRLAFAIAIRANSDILLIDEVLAVGDAIFQKKCFNYFKELKKEKKTVVLVSHDSNILQEYCNKGVLIENGKIVSQGTIDGVVNDYVDLLNNQEESQEQKNTPKNHTKENDNQLEWGTGEVKIVDVQTYEVTSGDARKLFTQKNPEIGVRVTFRAVTDCESPVYGITIHDLAGQRIFQSNTLWSKVDTPKIKAKQKVSVDWRVPNIFNTGDFSIAPAVADQGGTVIYNWKDDALRFKVRKVLRSSGFANIEHDIKVSTSDKAN